LTNFRAIKITYEGIFASVRTQDETINDFPIVIGLYRGSIISPYFLTLVLDVLTKHINELTHRCMLTIMFGESMEEFNGRLKTSLRNAWICISLEQDKVYRM